jgi:hypothetical protein
MESVVAKGIRSYGLGKFIKIIDQYIYEVTLDGGADEEAGYSEGSGWFGLVRLDDPTRKRARRIAVENDDELTPEEGDLLDESVAVILFERSDGIVEADWYSDEAEANEVWAEIEEDVEHDGEEEGEGDEDDEEEEDEDDERESGEIVSESSRGKPDSIEVWWDTQDPHNLGWAFRAYWRDRSGRVEHEESGEVDGRSDLSDTTLVRRARAAAGYPGSRIPVKIH